MALDLLAPIRKSITALTNAFDIDYSTNDSANGYDAIKDHPNRRPYKRRVYPQDRKMRNQWRERAIATAQDIQQNFAVVAWAIRKHLDYVSDMRFRADTGSDRRDQILEAFMLQWGTRFNCDVRQRHPLRRMIRLAEMRRLVDGDFFMLKLGGRGRNRGKLQPIEGYRVQNPQEMDIDAANRWINGVQVGAAGQAIRYAVWHRDMNGILHFDGEIPSPNICPIGYYERYDQVRGVSPLMAGLGEFMDVMDSVTLMKSKLKLQQLFAFATFRDFSPTRADGTPVSTTDEDEDGIPERDWQFSFDGMPQQVDGITTDRFELLESNSPATESVEFMRFILSIALKALDLPDSFLKESETNFFGSRAALTQYLTSARSKRADLSEFLDEITRWRLGMAIADGQLRMRFDDVNWKWVHVGQPWAWDPEKEMRAAVGSIPNGIDSFERICLLNGTTPQDNIDEYNKWADYAENRYGRPLQMATEMTASEPEPKQPQEPQEETDE